MKKIASLLLVMLLAAGAASAQALTLTGLANETIGRVWEENRFFPRMEALTGIPVTAHGVQETAEYEEILNRMLTGALPADVLFKSNLTRQQEIDLLNAGALIDLAPLIEENMPHLAALLADHPEWRDIITLDDGRIASLPLFNPAERQVCVFINKVWLDDLGLAMPKTLDELTEVLTAMKNGDPNKNGKHDEIAADLMGVFEMRWLLPYFGIVADDSHIARSADGSFVFAPELPAYRDFIALLRDWTDKGLLEDTAFTGMHSMTARNAGRQDQPPISGLIVSPTPFTHVNASHICDYEALLLPAPDGEIYWRDFLGEVWTGCFAVTSTCENPAEALRWADALYTEEGALLAYAGIEGEDYTFDASGSWGFSAKNAQEASAIRSGSLIYTGAPIPALYPADFIAKVNSPADVHVMTQSKLVQAHSTCVAPAYFLPADKQVRADELALTVGAEVECGIARFASGEVELTDETYADWQNTLREAGSEELVSLYNSAR